MTDIADLTLDPNWDPGCPTCRSTTSGIATLAMLPQGRSWTLAPALAALGLSAAACGRATCTVFVCTM